MRAFGLAGIPTDSAHEIIASLKSRGQLSLRALIKFSDAPLVELDASNCASPTHLQTAVLN